jgi:hypothetical protein
MPEMPYQPCRPHTNEESARVTHDGSLSSLPHTAAERKTYPLATGCLDYFPLALIEVAHVSYVGNEQHNPGQPLHWDRSKSRDEADALLRHLVQRGTVDTDGVRHSAKVAWRALALLQKELEGEKV